jgi:hypothetical protein
MPNSEREPAMSGTEPAEERIGGCDEPVATQGRPGETAAGGGQDRPDDNAPLESEENWAGLLDWLISWALAQGDEAVDQIYTYLEQRSAENRARPSHDLLPGWSRTSIHRSLPYRGRGRDEACSELRRRLRSHHGLMPRPLGAERPPRNRRMSG